MMQVVLTIIESLGSFGSDATVDAGKELDQQRCFRLKNVKNRNSVVPNLQTGYEKPNSRYPLLANSSLSQTDC